MTEKPKRPRGRPVERQMPDTPENIMRALLTTPPKRDDECGYLKRGAD